MLGQWLLALTVLVQPQEPPRPITLFAAISLKEVATEIATIAARRGSVVL